MCATKKSKAKSEPLRPCHEIFSRLRWDPKVDESRFTVGYQDRFAGIKEKALTAFLFAGEVPWHRIRYIRCDSWMLWDREARLDQVEEVLARLQPAEPQEPAVQNSASVSPAPASPIDDISRGAASATQQDCWRFDRANEDWVIATSTLDERSSAPTRWRWVTWNILFDIYDVAQTLPDQRWPRLWRSLAHQKADVIALQEVTPRACASLLAQAWVREGYYVSAMPQDVHPHTTLLLSRFPFQTRFPLRPFAQRAVDHTEALSLGFVSPQQYQDSMAAMTRRLQVACFAFAEGSWFCANLHLSSNRSQERRPLRAHQLQILADALDELETSHDQVLGSAVLGDFNAHDDAEFHDLRQRGFLDLWTQYTPNKAGLTYDPGANHIAGRLSLSGRAGRLDRILARTHQQAFVPQSIAMLGKKAIAQDPLPLHMSDHFGLCARIQMREPTAGDLAAMPGTSEQQTPRKPTAPTFPAVCEATPGPHSALAVVPPESLWAPIQAIREVHDPNVKRWMPHLNLLFGFVEPKHFAHASAIIETLLADLGPISICLDAFDSFTHRKHHTVWLRPRIEPEAALSTLQRKLAEAFPACGATSLTRGFTPHLTVARFAKGKEREMQRALKAWNKSWQPLHFTIQELHWLHRGPDTAFSTLRCFPLVHPTSPKSRAVASTPTRSANFETLEAWMSTEGVLLSLKTRQSREAVFASLRREVCATLDELRLHRAAVPLHRLGSTRTQTALAGSDIDAVCIYSGECSTEVLLTQLAQRLDAHEAVTSLRIVPHAIVPALKCVWKGIAIDLLCAAVPQDLAVQPIEAWSLPQLRLCSDAAARAILGCLEADALLDAAPDVLEVSTFRTLLQAVKLWARRQQLDTPAIGYLGGYGWSLLALYACRDATELGLHDTSPRRWLTQIFHWIATLSTTEPIAWNQELPDAMRHQMRAALPLISLLPPHQLVARQVTPSTLATIQDAANEAAGLCASDTPDEALWSQLFAAQEHEATHAHLRLTLTCKAEEALVAAIGRASANMPSLLVKLEALGLHPRPWPFVVEQATAELHTASCAIELHHNEQKPSPTLVAEAAVCASAFVRERRVHATVTHKH